jgi:tetratricopeptide (TPR) repeat protein
MTRLIPAAALTAFFAVSGVCAQSPGVSAPDPGEGGQGGAALADRYVSWVEEQIARERWTAALLALERAGDFAGESSDISYLSALCRFHLDYARRPILEKLRQALETGRWYRYAPLDAEILEARILVQLRRYKDALSVLSKLPESLESSELSLAALKGAGDGPAFRAAASRALSLYPRASGPAALVLDYGRSRLPREGDRDLVNLVLRRLPLLLDEDPDLAYKALPFIRDSGEARRLIAAYRASGNPSPLSLPPALNLGRVSEIQAIEELFTSGPDAGSATLP